MAKKIILIFSLLLTLTGCRRDPDLNLHRGGTRSEVEIESINFELETYWDYEFEYGIEYDWQAEWSYGWDDEDTKLFGGELNKFEANDGFVIRGYNKKDNPDAPHQYPDLHTTTSGNSFSTRFDWGLWDMLTWNNVVNPEGSPYVRIDEETTFEYVTAYTNQTMHSVKYNSPYQRAFYQPEQLFSAYKRNIDINQSMEGFVLDSLRNVWVLKMDMLLQPVTYVYLTQIILHNNKGKISSIDGTAFISGMARTANLNTGFSGSDPITLYYNVRMKKGIERNGELVDIIGGRVITFGICDNNPNLTRGTGVNYDDPNKHYIDINMQFSNGNDSAFVFDVTKKVKKLFKGGVITIELDMDTISPPKKPGGSAFDAVVKDFEENEWEIEM